MPAPSFVGEFILAATSLIIGSLAATRINTWLGGRADIEDDVTEIDERVNTIEQVVEGHDDAGIQGLGTRLQTVEDKLDQHSDEIQKTRNDIQQVEQVIEELQQTLENAQYMSAGDTGPNEE